MTKLEGCKYQNNENIPKQLSKFHTFKFYVLRERIYVQEIRKKLQMSIGFQYVSGQ